MKKVKADKNTAAKAVRSNTVRSGVGYKTNDQTAYVTCLDQYGMEMTEEYPDCRVETERDERKDRILGFTIFRGMGNVVAHYKYDSVMKLEVQDN